MDMLNAFYKNTPRDIEIALACSMFGWDTPIAKHFDQIKGNPMYQVIITLDFEGKPTDADVHDACRTWADEMRNDYELREPYKDPFDMPKRERA